MVKRSRGTLLVALGAVVVLIVGLFAGLLGPIWANDCNNPIFVASGRGNPTPPFADIVALQGGLPKTTAEMTSHLAFTAQTGIFPVTSWQIVKSHVSDSTPILTRILDDDPTYAITLDVEIQYADGDSRLLRWTTWQYGLVLCPALFPYGYGPPWQVRAVH